MKTAILNFRVEFALRDRLEKFAARDSRELAQAARLAVLRGLDVLEHELDARDAGDWAKRHLLRNTRRS